VHHAVVHVEVQQRRIADALDADRHLQLGIPADHAGDRLDQLLHGGRSAGRLSGRTATQLVATRQPVERIVQSASHVTVLPSGKPPRTTVPVRRRI
jgi:hypothetical protein